MSIQKMVRASREREQERQNKRLNECAQYATETLEGLGLKPTTTGWISIRISHAEWRHTPAFLCRVPYADEGEPFTEVPDFEFVCFPVHDTSDLPMRAHCKLTVRGFCEDCGDDVFSSPILNSRILGSPAFRPEAQAANADLFRRIVDEPPSAWGRVAPSLVPTTLDEPLHAEFCTRRRTT